METTNIDNWMEIVFRCKSNEAESLLKKIFYDIEKHELGLIPHYTIRIKKGNEYVPVNVHLFKAKEEDEIIQVLNKHISNFNHSYEYGKNNQLNDYFCWKKPGFDAMGFWTENNARYMHELCKFVLNTKKPDDPISCEYGVVWGHHLNNSMMPIKFPDYRGCIP